MDEWTVVDPDTGGRKGQKLARFDLIPPTALRQLANHFGRGAQKYEDRNWEKGYRYSLSYAAAMRHLNAWWAGEEHDEDGNHHLDAVMFHCMALREFGNRGVGTDDRFGPLTPQEATQGPITPTQEMYEAFRTEEARREPVEQATDSEQAPPEGWERTIQARRWEIP